MRVKFKYMAALLLLGLLMIVPGQQTQGRSKKKKDKSKVEAAAPKKTPYEKFITKKGLVTSKGDITVYKDADKIFIEYPDSLMGREVCISTHVLESGDPLFAEGLDVSGNSTDFRISRTDSLVVFRVPRLPIIVSPKDSALLGALELSRAEAVKYAFPIKYRNADSTAVVFEATDLFDTSEESSVDLYACWTEGGRIVESKKVDELSAFTEVMSFPGSIAVVQDATFDVELNLGSDTRLSATLVTTLSLLEENLMSVRKADDRIGLKTVRAQSFDSKEGFRSISIARRWDLSGGRKIRVYVDTLMPQSWQKAVSEGLEAWNPAFEKAGLGEGVVEALPYPSDSTFSAFNPSVSTVSFCGGGGRSISAGISTDSRTGEIRNCSITIPGEYLLGLLFSTSFTIGDVDPRYTSFNLPDDAVCEVLKAQIMRAFGFCLGLGSNCAGSLAYTPEELRDPAFTSSHGITASVMDNVLFNILARPGDRERGVVTIIDRVGPYDAYAIDWLYGDYPSEEALDSLIESKAGQMEYLYVPLQRNTPDPRANDYDFGSDAFEAFDAMMSHLKYAAANADKWFSSPSIPEEEFKQLYADWIWLKMIDCTRMLSPFVGGVYSDPVIAGKEGEHFRAVPRDIQKKAVSSVLGTFLDMDWMNSNKALLTMSGAYSTFSQLSYMNAVGQSKLLSRLPLVSRAQRIAGSTYSPEEFLEDVQAVLFRDVVKGKLSEQEDDMIFRYLRSLMGLSPVMKSNFNEAFHSDSKSLADLSDFSASTDSFGADDDEFFIPLGSVSSVDTEGQEIVALKALRKARTALVQGKSRATDKYTRGKIDFLIYVADVCLKGNGKK